MDREALQATVHGVAKSWTRLSTHARKYKQVYFFKQRNERYVGGNQKMKCESRLCRTHLKIPEEDKTIDQIIKL